MNIEQTSSEVKRSECPVCHGAGRYIAHRPECTDSNCQIHRGSKSCGGIMIECHACGGSGVRSSWGDKVPAVAK